MILWKRPFKRKRVFFRRLIEIYREVKYVLFFNAYFFFFFYVLSSMTCPYVSRIFKCIFLFSSSEQTTNATGYDTSSRWLIRRYPTPSPRGRLVNPSGNPIARRDGRCELVSRLTHGFRVESKKKTTSGVEKNVSRRRR